MASAEDSENKMDGSSTATTTATNGSSSFTSSTSNDRRVLKPKIIAKRPVASTTPSVTNAGTNINLDESIGEEEEDNPTIWSPSKPQRNPKAVASQIVDEGLSNRHAAVHHRHQEAKNNKYKEKRNAEKKIPSSGNGSTTQKDPTKMAHPISKALFRVGTSQPHHKRPADATSTTISTTTDGKNKPEEKRMRLDDDDDDEDDDTKKKNASYLRGGGGTLMVVLAVTVAVAGIVVMAVARRRRA
jgi:hypothetical protein